MGKLYDFLTNEYTKLQNMQNIKDMFNPLILQNVEAISHINNCLKKCGMKNLNFLSNIFNEAFIDMKTINLTKLESFIKKIYNGKTINNFAERELMVKILQEKDDNEKYSFGEESYESMLNSINVIYRLGKDEKKPKKLIVYKDELPKYDFNTAKTIISCSPVKLSILLFNTDLLICIEVNRDGMEISDILPSPKPNNYCFFIKYDENIVKTEKLDSTSKE